MNKSAVQRGLQARWLWLPMLSCVAMACGDGGPPVRSAQLCDGDVDCPGGFICQIDRCVPGSQAGEPCSGDNECVGGLSCVAGLCGEPPMRDPNDDPPTPTSRCVDDDPHAPNHDPSSAAVLGDGIFEAFVCVGQDDWFRVDVDVPSELRVEILVNTDVPEMPELELLRGDGAQVLATAEPGGAGLTLVKELAAGGYALRVRGVGQEDTALGYKLGISVTDLDMGGPPVDDPPIDDPPVDDPPVDDPPVDDPPVDDPPVDDPPVDDPPDDPPVDDPPPVQDCDHDALEPNDTLAEAHGLEPGPQAELKTCAGNEDYYSVVLAPRDRLDVSLSFSHAAGNIDVDLLDPNGTRLTGSSGELDFESFSHGSVEGGTFIIRVFLPNGGENGYDLSIFVAPNGADDGGVDPPSDGPAEDCITGDDGLEQNDDFGDALPVTTGSASDLIVCGDDEDWYEFLVPAGFRLTVLAQFDGASANLDIEVFDVLGLFLGASEGVANSEGFRYTNPNLFFPRTIYVRIFLNRGDYLNYSLSATLD